MKTMKIKACIDKAFKTMEIHVCNNEMNQEVSALVKELDQWMNDSIVGTDERGEKCVLTLNGMICFYAEGQKVFAEDERGVYSISNKLYELEEMLEDTRFIRISKSEIVNLKKIKKLDLSLTGTIKIILFNGRETYTSRRNVGRLKKALGIS
ncbi:MAG: LytTR family transcriptional regulator [Lachnospiraceae bacterium]|nr:LytTR family transcriptional regulator [Lachnospiraceae bacterium]